MLLLLPAIAAFLLALALGGSIRGFATLKIRSSGLILCSLLIQIVIYLPILRRSPQVVDHAEAIYLFALCLVLFGMVRNWGLGAPVRIATLGLLLNGVVIAANSGHMPVNMHALRITQGAQSVQTAQDPRTYGNTRPADSASNLLPISDLIPVYLPGYGGNVYSLGDVLIATGIAWLVFRTLIPTIGGMRRTRPASRVVSTE